ncbi:hypothetical protein CMI47_02880 [Candidatus Pacearchaeota archaeon]|nr:hypothetical protein [Candidatus Pacearchaeota archaeon]
MEVPGKLFGGKQFTLPSPRLLVLPDLALGAGAEVWDQLPATQAAPGRREEPTAVWEARPIGVELHAVLPSCSAASWQVIGSVCGVTWHPSNACLPLA